ncbi:MAG: hypothetical protein H9Q67_06315 [Spiroplasma ixodetis]|nr:hypothetical protein [Spiroplasma ixodetis]
MYLNRLLITYNLSYNHQIYELKEIALEPIIKEESVKIKKVYIPNKDHPWRYGYQ